MSRLSFSSLPPPTSRPSGGEETTFPNLTIYDRPLLAVEQLTKLDPGGFVRAAFKPELLSPQQLKGWVPKDDHPISTALRTVASPLAILGLVLTMRYPVTRAKDMFRIFKKVEQGQKTLEMVAPYSKALPPVIWRLMSAASVFGGTKFGKFMERLVADVHQFKIDCLTKWGGGLVGVEKAMGRSANLTEQVATSMVLDGLHRGTDSKFWRMARDTVRKDMIAAGQSAKEVEAIISKAGVQINGGVESLAPQKLVQLGRESLQDVIQRMFGPNGERIDELVKAKVRRGDRTVRGVLSELRAQGIYFGGKVESRDQVAFFKKMKKALVEKDFKVLEEYFPHVERPDYEHMWEYAQRQNEYYKNLIDMTPAGRRSMAKHQLETEMSKNLQARNMGMIPSLNDFDLVADKFTPETREVLERMAKWKVGKEGVEHLRFRQYSLRLPAVMERYQHGMARTYGWTARGWGPLLKKELAVMESEAGVDPLKISLARDTYLPAAMGKMSEDEMMHALGWSYWKTKAKDFFDSPQVRKVAGGLSDKMIGWLSTPQVQDLTVKNAGAKVAGWLYASALGFNPASMGFNLMQNLMTTAGVVEPKYLIGGFWAALKDSKRFTEVYARGGLTVDEAFTKAVPYYAKHLGYTSELEAMGALRRLRYGPSATKAGEAMAKVKTGLLSTFTATERFNKMWAYRAGEMKALKEGMRKPFAEAFGSMVSDVTQLPASPYTTPTSLLNLNPVWRQFLQFPIRIAELAGPRGGLLGASVKQGAMDYNWGTTGRMLMAGSMVYGVGRLAGLDLSQGLLLGAVPGPFGEEAPFYPFPFVPPAASIVGGAAMDVYGGTFEHTRKNLPLFVPGGVELARLASVGSPAVAKAIGRPYADYDNRLPNGAVAVYSADGSLKQFKKPLEIFGDAVGFRTVTGDREGEIMRYLLSQRDQIRGMEREYHEKLAANDVDGAERVQAEYQKQYPELGRIVTQAQDIRAIHLRHDISRIERLLETMSPEVRQMFGPMVGVAMGEAAESHLGINPEYLTSQPTISKRDPYRARPSGPQVQNARQNLQGMQGNEQRVGRLSPLRPDQGGSIRGPSFTPFSPF